MPFNLHRKILDITGNEVQVTYYTQEQVDAARERDADGKPIGGADPDKLPRETVGSVLLFCLSFFNPTTAKDGHKILKCLRKVRAAMESESGILAINPLLVAFIVKAVQDQTIVAVKNQDGTPGERGKYKAWATAQALEELGVTDDSDDEEEAPTGPQAAPAPQQPNQPANEPKQ